METNSFFNLANRLLIVTKVIFPVGDGNDSIKAYHDVEQVTKVIFPVGDGNLNAASTVFDALSVTKVIFPVGDGN